MTNRESEEPRRGVAWQPIMVWGALCPKCGKRAPVTKTMEASGGYRVRYHECQACNWAGKSIQALRD